jgi:myo-inositol-1(or 4)-monophosphatase
MYDMEHKVAAGAARSAGEVLKQKFGNVHHIGKKGEIDLVTEADLAAEKIILEILRLRPNIVHIATKSAWAGSSGATLKGDGIWE